MLCYVMLSYGMVWYGMVWYGIVCMYVSIWISKKYTNNCPNVVSMWKGKIIFVTLYNNSRVQRLDRVEKNRWLSPPQSRPPILVQ